MGALKAARDAEAERAIAQAYAAGVPVREIGIHASTARDIAVRHGFAARRPGTRVIDEAVRDGTARGETNGQIAARLGVPLQLVQRSRRAMGVPAPKRFVRTARFDARCLMLEARGWKSQRIARELGVSRTTVENALRGGDRRRWYARPRR